MYVQFEDVKLFEQDNYIYCNRITAHIAMHWWLLSSRKIDFVELSKNYISCEKYSFSVKYVVVTSAATSFAYRSIGDLSI